MRRDLTSTYTFSRLTHMFMSIWARCSYVCMWYVGIHFMHWSWGFRTSVFHFVYEYMYMYTMRHITQSKATQQHHLRLLHFSSFQRKSELPQVGFEPTSLHACMYAWKYCIQCMFISPVQVSWCIQTQYHGVHWAHWAQQPPHYAELLHQRSRMPKSSHCKELWREMEIALLAVTYARSSKLAVQ